MTTEIDFQVPGRQEPGYIKRQRKMMRAYARYLRAGDRAASFANTDGADLAKMADAMDEVDKATGEFLDYLAEFITRPDGYDAKIAAIEELSEEDYQAMVQAIMGGVGGEEESENPT